MHVQLTIAKSELLWQEMDKYPVVVEQLVSAAIDQGMGTDTEVTAVADGGNGLREALEAGFTHLKFIQGPRSSFYSTFIKQLTLSD